MAGSLTVPSPDGRSTLAIAYRERGDELKHSFDSSHSVRLSGRAGSNRFRERYQAIGDVLWSPDSRHVAVSLSGGGVGGVYDLYVLGTGRTAHPISLPFRRLLNPPRNCDLGRFSNVAAVKWLAGERLLVMARQLWEDSCPQKDRAVFYDYDLTTRKVRRSYRLAEAKRIFGAALGSLAR